MELSTLNTIENILRADRTVTPGQRRAILSVCTGEAPSPRRAERMLTATEISERFHIMANKPIGLKTIRNWANSGKLPFVQVSKTRRLFKEADVINLFCGPQEPQDQQNA